MIRNPLLHFLVLGALLSAGRAALPEPRGTLRLDPAEVAAVRAEWQRETGRAPSAAQLEASLQRRLDEELLLHEALRAGLATSDPVARSRLLMNMRFAFPQRAGDEALLAEALALGMPSRDLVVRRRLVQLMERRLATGVRFDEAQIAAYVAAHPQRYAQPARWSFRQVYFSRDAHADAPAAAQAALAEADTAAGDPFLLGREFRDLTRDDVARMFGAAFADQLVAVPVGQWNGPIASVYGAHLVLIERIQDEQPADVDAVKHGAGYALRHEREAAMVRQQVAALRSRYRVELP